MYSSATSGTGVNLAEIARRNVRYSGPAQLPAPIDDPGGINDGADALATTPVRTAASRWRARALAMLALLLGALSVVLLYYVPLASTTFPWYRAGLSLAGIVSAIAALRTRPRGRLAMIVAVTGLVLSLAFPALVVIVFVRYFNWKG